MSRCILIVDDNALERKLLSSLLDKEYNIHAADGGAAMFAMLETLADSVSAILLDIVMPEMDGWEALRRLRADKKLAQIPVIVTTELTDENSQVRALSLGANGYVHKPFNQQLLMYTLQNAISLREQSALVSSPRTDALTGLLTREAFLTEAQELIAQHDAGTYTLSCFDIESFKVINNQYGTETGDRVLRHIAKCIDEPVAKYGGLTCRIMGDKFAVLYPSEKKEGAEIAECHEKILHPPCIDRSLRICVGRYDVSDKTINVSEMYDCASLAAASIKGRYDTYVAEYDNIMLENLLTEQRIVNEMGDALENGQFEAWFQPQYNHTNGSLIGSEALVRWRRNGSLVPPNVFIPIFERSGFIYKMDQYIWRQVCKLLARWREEGRELLPISVNISRYDILQEDFFGVICGLILEYEIPVDMLRLEITESAFSETGTNIISIVKALIDFGFTVEIDDFGSGYSSLNTLKDVPASILKLDMRFLEKADDERRGGSILESVVRMAKWLGMSVIAEGVEEKIQADYLKSIGCHYIQGYFYARPMPMQEYEALQARAEKEPKLAGLNTLDTLDSNEFWNPKSLETLIFNSYVGGAAIIEYHRRHIELLRTNDRYTQEFGGASKNGIPLGVIPPEEILDAEMLSLFRETIETAIDRAHEQSCELTFNNIDSEHGSVLFLSVTLRRIAWTNERSLLYCVISNTTAQRLAERRERDMYAELLDNLPCGAGRYEFDGKRLTVVSLNRGYWELVGRSAVECEGIDVLDTVHPDDRGLLLPEITDAILEQRDGVCEIRLRYGENGYRAFHVVVRIRRRGDTKYSLYAFFMPASDQTLLLEEQNRSRRERGRLDFIFRNAAISVWTYNAKTGEIIQNERSRELHGGDAVISNVPKSLISSGFVHSDSAKEYREMYAALKEGAKEMEGVFRVRNATGTGYWFEHIRYAAISADEPGLYFGISTDVSTEYEQEDTIRQWMSLLSEMQVESNDVSEFNLSTNAFVRHQGSLFVPFVFDENETFDSCIKNWARACVLREDAEKVLGFLSREKLLSMHELGVLDGGIDYRALINGEIRWCSLSIKFIEYPTDEQVRIIMVHTDIHSRKEDELKLIEENRRDALTGVLNRKAFERRVNELIAASPETPNALFMIDLDNFKIVNDSCGHLAGDSVLMATAKGLSSMLNSDDLVGRIGGDEFMVFLADISSREVIKRRAEMILEMIRRGVGGGIDLTASLGIAQSPKDGDNFEALYRSADKAAYFSKQQGKNRVTFYAAEKNMDFHYDDTLSKIDFESEDALRAWDERMKHILAENQRLIEHQEEDERYRMVIESTHIITFEYNAETDRFAASPDFYSYVLSKQSGEQFFSEKVDVSGIHPDDRALFYGKFLERILSGEAAPETALRLELIGGGYRWVRLSALTFFDKAERLTKGIGIIKEEDIQKKRTDIELDAIFKYMAGGVLLLEIKKPRISALHVSESFFRLENTTGISYDSENMLSHVHPDDYPRLRDKLFICSLSGAVMEENFRVVHDGKALWRHMHAVRIPYPDAVNPVMIAVETDITNIKEHEELLEAQLRMLASELSEINIITWCYIPHERSAVLSRHIASALNLPEKLVGAPNSFIQTGVIHSDDAEDFLLLHKRLEQGEVHASSNIRIKRGNIFVNYRLSYIVVPDRDGRISCAIGIAEPTDTCKSQ